MSYAVYIMANKPRGITYVGMTNDLSRRVYEHRQGIGSQFCKRYGITMLVYVDYFDDPHDAIACEKRFKKWKQAWKFKTIEAQNPNWDDLYERLNW